MNILDRALKGIRETSAEAKQVEAAAERVLHKLSSEHNKVVQHPSVDRIQSCEDFRAPNLTPSQKLLLEDHLTECAACRKALRGRNQGLNGLHGLKSARSAQALAFRFLAAAAAAALLVVAGLQSVTVRDFIWPVDVHATALRVDGGLYSFAGQDVRAVNAGQRVERYQSLRTGNDSGAVLELADGSRIEMGARAEVSLDRADDGVKIKLDRGNIIVTAAKQRDGHLYVETKDCTISVVGTVFSVNSGAKGSRVSVIEGEVHVQHSDAKQALFPGQQMSTNPVMGQIPVQQEIAWSRDAEVLKQMLEFTQNVALRIEKVEPRHTSNLVPLVPEGTVLFASLPNVSQSIGESYALFKQRIAENQMLKEWWQPNTRSASGLSFDEVIQRVITMGAFLGPEVIIAFPKDMRNEAPVLLADVTRPDDLVAALKDLQANAGPDAKFPEVYVDRSLLIVSPARQLQRSLAFRQQPTLNSFSRTKLYQRLEKAYIEGAGWLLAADLQSLVSPGEKEVQQLGLANMEQLFVEQKTGSAGATFRATIGFNDTRRGMAAWLADPAPMGALDFVSPGAYGVAAVITKDPSLMVDDIFSVIQQNPAAQQDLENYQREHRVDIKRDLAAPLGNEFLVAMDGPLLPNPSWKLVIEVNDAARLQNAIQWSISEVNREAAARQEPAITLASETVSGRTYYTASTPRFPTAINYTFWAGYMIIAPSRALLVEAIQNHDTGNTLARSEAFRSQFPADGRDYASGFVYQNIQAVANALPASTFQKAFDALPTLVVLYGEPDRIVMSSKGVLGMNIAGLTGMQGMLQAAGMR